MSASVPDQAFILAAGLGTRLRPYTNDRPKPMVEVAGRSLISRILDHLQEAGVKDVVVNLHYRGDQIKEHLKTRTRPNVHFSEETDILNTGGGLKQGLQFLDRTRPFFTVNGDALWSDGIEAPALQKLAKTWDDEHMDILLLLQPVADMTLTGGVGDYDRAADGRASRSHDQSGAYMFTGIRLHHPRIFEDCPDGAFSYLELMDRAQDQGRLFALVHDGAWHHISTPEDYHNVDAEHRKQAVYK